MSDFHRLREGYIGVSESHRRFVRRLALVKVFIFPATDKSSLENSATEDPKKSLRVIQQHFNNPAQPSSLAMVTNLISQTQFQAIVLRRNEFELMATETDLNKLKSYMFPPIYSDTWRVFDDFRIDLCCEINTMLGNPDVDRWKLSKHKPLEEAYERIRLALYPNQLADWNQKKIRYLIALARFTRNAIEHRDGYVDAKSLSQWTDTPFSSAPYYDGDFVKAGPKEVGELIAFVETLAEDMDKRAIKKFPKIADK